MLAGLAGQRQVAAAGFQRAVSLERLRWILVLVVACGVTLLVWLLGNHFTALLRSRALTQGDRWVWWGGPALVFNRAGSVWNNYYDDGRYLVESVDERSGALRIEGSTSACPVICKRIEGWMERALELTIGPQAHPTIRETDHVHRDGPGAPTYCRFAAQWTR